MLKRYDTFCVACFHQEKCVSMQNLWKLTIHNHIHKMPPLEPILNQLKPLNLNTFLKNKIVALSSHLRPENIVSISESLHMCWPCLYWAKEKTYSLETLTSSGTEWYFGSFTLTASEQTLYQTYFFIYKDVGTFLGQSHTLIEHWKPIYLFRRQI
jgi:hypothetical protein